MLYRPHTTASLGKTAGAAFLGPHSLCHAMAKFSVASGLGKDGGDVSRKA